MKVIGWNVVGIIVAVGLSGWWLAKNKRRTDKRRKEKGDAVARARGENYKKQHLSKQKAEEMML